MQTVSVIIPNYNYGRFLRQAIESVLEQSMKPHEVIIVDDGSTDDSKAVLSSFGASVRTVEQQNSGVGAARNAGADVATGEFLAFLDADDFWHREKLEKQMRKFGSDTEIGLVHCGLTNTDANGVPTDDYLIGAEGWVADSLLRLQPAVIATTIVVRRALFIKVGGYDTDRDLHPSEDWDLCYRLARECKVGFVREPLHFYRQHGSGGHTRIERMERAVLIAFEKAFRDADVQRFRREAYGNLYSILAGSYYHSGQIGRSLVCALKGLVYRPSSVTKLTGFPFRAGRQAFLDRLT